MRFRLRTLLIVVSILAAVLARVAYLKRQRDFHRQEVHRLVTQLASTPGSEGERVLARQVHELAAFGPAARGSWIGSGALPPGQDGSSEYESTMTAWHEAKQHELLANRYSRAIYRPWTLVWDDPNSVPDAVRFVDSRLAMLLTTAVIAALAAWRIAVRFRVRHRATGESV
jgi:hypothetical protein